MIKYIWKFIYYYIVSPLLLIIIHLIFPFSSKIRKGLSPRYKSIRNLRDWLKQNNLNRKRILFHAASLGEFEHIKPLIQNLKSNYNTTNIVTFFSPSGYDNVKNVPGLDFSMYMPFDRPGNWRALYSLLKPTIIVISKHDVWPAQIWEAKKLGIPVYLINASLGPKSSRASSGVKQFLKHVYRDFNKIYTISENDATSFAKYYPRCSVEVIGDTKYDQVVIRKKEALTKEIIPNNWIEGKYIFIAGSIWPDDTQHIYPVFKKILKDKENFNLVLVPHEPSEKIIENIFTEFKDWRVSTFSNNKNIKDERILIIDAIGYLANLYKYASAAYVGGSFRQGIHNVMEPAIYGIPVFYGPVHTNSYEAIKLAEGNGGIIISESKEMVDWLERFFEDDIISKQLGTKAENYALRNTGSTEKLMIRWQSLLKENGK